jgi:hypothetical protein
MMSSTVLRFSMRPDEDRLIRLPELPQLQAGGCSFIGNRGAQRTGSAP